MYLGIQILHRVDAVDDTEQSRLHLPRERLKKY